RHHTTRLFVPTLRSSDLLVGAGIATSFLRTGEHDDAHHDGAQDQTADTPDPRSKAGIIIAEFWMTGDSGCRIIWNITGVAVFSCTLDGVAFSPATADITVDAVSGGHPVKNHRV